LIAENMLLRQQLIIVERQIKRPKLTWWDRVYCFPPSSPLLFTLIRDPLLTRPAYNPDQRLEVGLEGVAWKRRGLWTALASVTCCRRIRL
ncbi:MAG: hypothetical protein M5R40_12615, partial [Anaerolineae bacterium]|nr:hypothetical protein [Anaerolineae bacterium]